MGTRLELQNELKTLIGTDKNVYFDPPESIKLTYPCIVYEWSSKVRDHADNKHYLKFQSYDLKYLTQDPDDTFPNTIEDHFMYNHPGAPYVSDSLYHFPFTIYY